MIPDALTHARCYGIGEHPDFLKARYRRLVLVSEPRHLNGFDPLDDDTLFVAHNWLCYQELLEARRHAVHFESETLTNPAPTEGFDLLQRAVDWAYSGAEDLTLFKGISLARCFAHELTLAFIERDRLRHAITGLSRRYQPEEIVFVNAATEYSALDMEGRVEAVRGAAATLGLTLRDRRDTEAGSSRYFRDLSGDYGQAVDDVAEWRASFLQPARRLASRLLSGIGRVRGAFAGRRPKIMVVSTYLTAIPLAEAFDGKGLQVLIFGPWYPKLRNLRFFWKNLVKGIVPFDAPFPDLTAGDRKEVAGIEERLKAAWLAGLLSEAPEILRYVQNHIIDRKRLANWARMVKWAAALFDAYRPDALLSDGLHDTFSNIMMATAKQRGLCVVHTLNGSIFYDFRMDSLGCDARLPPLIDVSCTWGPVNDAWLAAIQARVEVARTGSPISIRGTSSGRRDRNGRNILVLQYAASAWDVRWPQAEQYALFVRLIRRLADLGYDDIKVKLHPGASDLAFYGEVVRRFGLPCQLYRNEPFRDLLEWAGLVIGPAGSGAMPETLGAGVPYLPLLVAPTTMNTEYLRGVTLYPDVDALCEALMAGSYQEPDEVLALLFGERIENPAGRIWQVVRDRIPAARPTR